MSLVIRVKKQSGGDCRILELRGLYACIGEDRCGLLCSADPATAYFSLYALGERYLLRAEQNCVARPGGTLRADDRLIVKEGLFLEAGGRSFEFFMTSPAAEVLSRAEQPAVLELLGSGRDLAGSPRLVYRLMDLSRSYPLPPGLVLTLGSGEDDPLYIELPGVEPAHCRLVFQDGAVRVTPLAGAVRTTTGEFVREALSIIGDGALVLDPTGIVLYVKFPAAPEAFDPDPPAKEES